MARIRSIKPTFFRSRSVRALTSDEKLVWIGLWVTADDAGRLMDEPEILVGDLWALSLNATKINRALDGLAAKGRIFRYIVDEERYIQVNGWEHQKISHPTPSDLPPAPVRNDSGTTPESFRPDRRGKDRKGGEAPPTPFCANHPGGSGEDCRACGDARRAYDAWLRLEKSKPTPTPHAAKPGDGHDHRDDGNGWCPVCGERVVAA